MKMSKIGMLALLVVLATIIGPVSATTYNVDSSMSNQDIQNIITINATDGDTINFASGTYTGTYLSTSKSLNFVGNGAVLVGTGSNNVLTISSSDGLNITGFTINVNGLQNGITGSNVENCRIENNIIRDGGDAINIYQTYEHFTINNNTINNMSSSYGDGISLVNCASSLDMSSFVPSTITNNQISDTYYGIFLGGNFKGTVSDNTISDSSVNGMDIVGKHAATNGKLMANITDNTISGTPIGIEMDHPCVINLLLDGNSITGTSYSIQTNDDFDVAGTYDITVIFNYLGNTVSNDFQDATTSAHDNTGPGAYTK